jgi:BMFP domain-containing protein YqiC
MRTESIDRLARKLVETLPESLRAMRDEVEQNFRSVLRNGLARLDLVTREEFEVQETILARAREQQARLEERLAALEARLAASDAAAVVSSETSDAPAKESSRRTRKGKAGTEPERGDD